MPSQKRIPRFPIRVEARHPEGTSDDTDTRIGAQKRTLVNSAAEQITKESVAGQRFAFDWVDLPKIGDFLWPSAHARGKVHSRFSLQPQSRE